MQDEARHVAFGRLPLHDYYAQLTAAGPGGFYSITVSRFGSRLVTVDP